MSTRLLNSIILVFYCLVCPGQTSKPTEGEVVRKITILCINDPEKFREIIYEYSEGKLTKVAQYTNAFLTDYEVIQYNQFGNEEKRVFYGSQHEVIRTILTTYDSEQNRTEEKRMNNNGQIENIKKYDTLSRLTADYYFRDPHQPDVSCYYFLYEYSGEKFVKKSFYMNCALKSYEINTYNDLNQKIKTEFFSNNKLTKHVIFKYHNSELVCELTYSGSRGTTKPISGKKYLYNSKNQLTEVIENENLIKKNYYADNKLVKSENYDFSQGVPRPGSFCKNNIVEYEYY